MTLTFVSRPPAGAIEGTKRGLLRAVTFLAGLDCVEAIADAHFFLKRWCVYVFTVRRRKPTCFASSLLGKPCLHIAEFPAHDTAVPSCRGAAPIGNSVTGPDWENTSDNATRGIKPLLAAPPRRSNL
jgi:hypothetical protein